MGTKENPAPFDCHAAALPDEPLFTLLARDRSAPALVRDWAARRRHMIAVGLAPSSDIDKVHEASVLAAQMEAWRVRHVDAWRTPHQDNQVPAAPPTPEAA